MKHPIETLEQAWMAWIGLVQQEPEAWLLYPVSGSIMNWITIEFFDLDRRKDPIEKGEGNWRISGTFIGIIEQAVNQYERVLERRYHNCEQR